jgi:hypothetical protein
MSSESRNAHDMMLYCARSKSVEQADERLREVIGLCEQRINELNALIPTLTDLREQMILEYEKAHLKHVRDTAKNDEKAHLKRVEIAERSRKHQ